VSPGSAPGTKNGPVTGLKAGHTADGRSSTVRTAPAKQSWVLVVSTLPAGTSATGGCSPNV
jgi:hypothetical protein